MEYMRVPGIQGFPAFLPSAAGNSPHDMPGVSTRLVSSVNFKQIHLLQSPFCENLFIVGLETGLILGIRATRVTGRVMAMWAHTARQRVVVRILFTMTK